jgi:thymidylate kinase
MLVICIEGAHGSGKTELVELFRSAGYPVLDEMFMQSQPHMESLEAQSMVREAAWVTHWFERILRYNRENPAVPIVVSDRSPYSAVVYANQGEQLKASIATQIQELEQFTPVRVRTVLVEVEPSIHWQRICSRLEREPERARYNEGDEKWMWTVRNRYDQLRDVWTVFVNNNVSGALDRVKDIILSKFQ